ncbi:discoidin domain-containing protein [Luteolibacter flavescens]|uniref:Discoidin domain-containing protein n=1 Tax=Luteolibacter flavescens TaxID=1859460 RepID=A0ABT3FR24_9BACT|nr:discoidin domain-containing protein [Luteolibacter flavescens]MCW1885907.1 discoidin domain-containing protein [Luteolibacter flavescens]
MKELILDDFTRADGWQAYASGEAEMKVTVEDGALRLDFDFHGGGGFVVARKEFPMTMPVDYAFAFRVRGNAPKNKFEFKLADPSNQNAWRWQEDAFDFRDKPRELHLHGSSIDFAWGPAGGGAIEKLGAIEFVLSAGPGGKGTVWIDQFRFEDRTNRRKPHIATSSSAAGSNASCLLAEKPMCEWRPDPADKRPWLNLDFHLPREIGGLIIDWLPRPAKRAFAIEASDDGQEWKQIHRVGDARGNRSFIHLPVTRTRFLRLCFSIPAPGLKRVAVQSYTFSKTLIDTFHSIAAASKRGYYPRYLRREQSYWTCAGSPEGHTCALINEEGMVEPDKGSFSLEPFLQMDDKLITWADARRSVDMEPDGLPIPSAYWALPGLKLQTTAFATGTGHESVLFVRYRITNSSAKEIALNLFVTIRPFQVNPPWQEWHHLGGVSKICTLRRSGDAVCVNGEKAVIPLTTPTGFDCATYEQGSIVDHIATDTMPGQDKVKDDFGFASGALGFAMTLAAGTSHEVFVAVPFCRTTSLAKIRKIASMNGAVQFSQAVHDLRSRLDEVRFRMPSGPPRDAAETFKTAAGQILINRDGPALQPGPRRYTRSWIRDGVIMGAALLRAGETDALKDFMRWYAPHQRSTGFVPCCVDRSGPDWLVEHDSHGQLIYGARECFRFTGDLAFLREMWPHVRKAACFIERLRARRLTPEYQAKEKKDRHGLLPESASHEGYLAHPVHSYWDDFWALRGLIDAAAIARELKKNKDADAFEKIAASLRQSINDSLRLVIAERKLDYIPGSVEWADFDPTATSNAISLLQFDDLMPREQLDAMFDLFVHDFRRKHRGEMEWKNYTAYEIRIVGALVRLGKRDEAAELLETFLADRRPLRWNQWPEISWKDPRSPGHLGDVPHTWIAAEYMLAFASLFAWERESDESLMIASGIPAAWLDGPRGVEVKGLHTWHGTLDLTIKQDNALLIELSGDLRIPPGGFVLRPPCPGPIRSATVNGKAIPSISPDEIVIHDFPAKISISFNETRQKTRRQAAKEA